MSFDGEAFGHRVKSARTWTKLGVQELALRLGMSDEAIYEIERGERKRPPSKPVLNALADAVGQTPEWLLSGTAPPWAANDVITSGEADEIARLRDELEAEVARLRRANDQLEERLELEEPARPRRRRAG